MIVGAEITALFSIIIELTLVTKSTWIRHLFTHYELLGLAFSFVLSVAIGFPFGAHGTTAMIGAGISTAIMLLIYKFKLLKVYDNKDVIRTKWIAAKSTFMIVWKFAMLPIRAIKWMHKQYQLTRDSYILMRSKIRKVLHHG